MKTSIALHWAYLCALSFLISTSVANADCETDFARDNVFKLQAGAVRLHERKQPLSLLEDGRWAPILTHETVTTVSEFVPPDAVRVTSDAVYGVVGLVVIGDSGWIKEGRDGSWQPLDAGQSRKVLTTAFKSYLSLEGITDLTCSKQQRDGKPARVYRLQAPGDGISSRVKTTTVYFDEKSGLLLHAKIEGGLGKSKISQTITVTFDPAIKIAPPEGRD